MKLTLPLQWLSYPPAVYGIYLITQGVLTYLHYLGTADIGPMIGGLALWNGLTQGGVLIGLGGLIYMAFRET